MDNVFLLLAYIVLFSLIMCASVFIVGFVKLLLALIRPYTGDNDDNKSISRGS